LQREVLKEICCLMHADKATESSLKASSTEPLRECPLDVGWGASPSLQGSFPDHRIRGMRDHRCDSPCPGTLRNV
ncbi:MAG TPA: hypothetical protein VJ453_04375, partial [Terriglobales bacterium]|nr:hypothetical protein [Terriglobales bacterium]